MKQTIALLATATLLSGCVLNIEETTIDKEVHQNAEQFSSLSFDGGDVSGKLVIQGVVQDTISAYAHASIWAKNAEEANRIAERMALRWSGTTDARLIVDYPGTEREFVRIERLSIDAPQRFNVNLDLSSSDLEIHDMHGTVTAELSSGDMDISTTGRIELESSSGDIHATTGKGGTIEVSSGDVVVDVTSKHFDGLDIESSSGNVTIGLATGAGINLECETSSGSININYDGFVAFDDDGTLSIQLNGGGKLVRVECSSGNIQLSKY